MPLRVLIADDHRLVRRGFARLLDGVAGVEVVAEVASARDALAMTLSEPVDVVLMDISFDDDVDGIEATRRIKEKRPEVEVIALSGLVSRRALEEMVRAGASAFFAKACRAHHIVQALVDRTRPPPPQMQGAPAPRESVILHGLSEGLSIEAIGDRLGVSSTVVDRHIERLADELEGGDTPGYDLRRAGSPRVERGDER